MEVIYVLTLSPNNMRWAQNIKVLTENGKIEYANYWCNRWKSFKATTGQKVLIRCNNIIIGEAKILDIEKNKLPVYEVYKKYKEENGILPTENIDDFIKMLNTAFSSSVLIGRESELGCILLQEVNIFDEKDYYVKPVGNQHGRYYIEINQVI